MERSESILELIGALNKLQGVLKSVPKTKENSYFSSKYADLDTIWDTVRKPLTDNGLALVQTTAENDQGIPFLETLLLHTSGEWIKSELALNPVKSDPQSMGSAITYARRYAMSAMLGVSAEDDDDAERSMDRNGKASTPSKAPARTSQARPSPDQDQSKSPYWCTEHKTLWAKKTKDGKTWYSHKDGQGWCNMPTEAPAPQKTQDEAPPPQDDLFGPPTVVASADFNYRRRMFFETAMEKLGYESADAVAQAAGFKDAEAVIEGTDLKYVYRELEKLGPVSAPQRAQEPQGGPPDDDVEVI